MDWARIVVDWDFTVFLVVGILAILCAGAVVARHSPYGYDNQRGMGQKN